MKKRFREVVDYLDYDELSKIKNDLENGGFHIAKLINQKISESLKEHELTCSQCSAEINPNNTNTYTLIFGPQDFKKKATFCGLDCMEYFITKLKH